ncbi:ABC transporter permease [Flexivirga caeni]|uniref:ABC transporter permease n=1 Tax=Flexivirga caeni TaxID=2294115 RepID=A0A3M9M741_9MICO|nr:ABC transporter permease [Flexivirga caeni]RNI21380.1 ABC transporter permease [Flexivirga caeni]
MIESVPPAPRARMPWGGTAAVAIFCAEWRSGFRSGWFVALVTMPMVLFVLFGATVHGHLRGGLPVAAMLMVSFTCFGVVNQAIFAVGVAAAEQRGSGWLRRLRVSAMPMWSFFGGKVLLGFAAATVVLAGNAVLARCVGVGLPLGHLLRLWVVVLFGVVCLAPFGFALAYWVRPGAAGVIGNLVFLPLSYTSGFMTPVSGLPAPVAALSPYLPTLHWGNLAWAAIATQGQAADFGVRSPGHPWQDVAIVLAWALAAAVLATLGWRRDRDRDRIRG